MAEGHHRPDVICRANALLIGMARRLREALGVPVVCLLEGEDAFLDSLPSPEREILGGDSPAGDRRVAVHCAEPLLC